MLPSPFRAWGIFPLALLLVAASDQDWKEIPFQEEEDALYFVGKGLDQPSYSEARDTALAQALSAILLYKGVRVSGSLSIRRSEEARSLLQRLEAKGDSLLREIAVVQEHTEIQTTPKGQRRYSVWIQVRYPRAATQAFTPEEEKARGEYLQALLSYREALEKGEDEGTILLEGIRALAYSEAAGIPDEELQREVLRRVRGVNLTPLAEYGVELEGLGGSLRNFPVVFHRFSGEEEIVWSDAQGYARPSSLPVVQAALALEPILKLLSLPPNTHILALLAPLFASKRVTFPLALPWKSLGIRVRIEGGEGSGTRLLEERIIQSVTQLGVRVSRDPRANPVLELTLTLFPAESFAGVYRARWEGSVRLVDEQQGVLLAIPFSGGEGAVGKDPSRALRERQRLLPEALEAEVRNLIGHFLNPTP